MLVWYCELKVYLFIYLFWISQGCITDSDRMFSWLEPFLFAYSLPFSELPASSPRFICDISFTLWSSENSASFSRLFSCFTFSYPLYFYCGKVMSYHDLWLLNPSKLKNIRNIIIYRVFEQPTRELYLKFCFIFDHEISDRASTVHSGPYYTLL